jgi:hypothetical protein
MHLKLNRSPASEERTPHDAAQPWLDFGRWLAGETSPDKPVVPAFARTVPSFAEIADRHFRDLAPFAAQETSTNSTELRQTMHRRFIRALHLAFGPEDLNDLAARQPPHLFHLVEHLRADFDLLPEKSALAEPSGRSPAEASPSAARGRTLRSTSRCAG